MVTGIIKTVQEIGAYHRYMQRKDEYKLLKTQAQGHCTEAIDSAFRVETRLSLFDEADRLGWERVLGKNDLLSVNYLASGLQAIRPVCRVHIQGADENTIGYGTGFLVAPSLMITNHHLLSSINLADRALVEFNYEHDLNYILKESEIFQLDPTSFFYNNQALDFALVRVQALSKKGMPITEYNHFKLVEQSGKALVDEHVTIIQHPNGRHKQIALRSNRVLGTVGDFIHYETDTRPGSSGSCVLNDQWQVVALHHASVPRKDDFGRPLTKDGQLWQPGMDEGTVDWIANEGIRISAIFRHLREVAMQQSDVQSALTEIFPNAPTGQRHNCRSTLRRGQNSEFDSLLINNFACSDTEVPVITIEQFHRMIDNPETTEADLAPYILIDAELSNAFSPAFRLNQNLVVNEPGIESELVLTWANSWSKWRRHQAYRRRLAQNPSAIKIVSEGDSWFQFPILLDDVVDHLMKDQSFAIYSLGSAGDHLSDMIAKGEYLAAIEQEKPAIFLISGGGNDLAGSGRLASLVHPFNRALAPTDYLNENFRAFEEQIQRHYQRLFEQLHNQYPSLTTICHGYDYVVPGHARWLGDPLKQQGIDNPILQRKIVQVIIDRMNKTISQIANQYNRVIYLDLRQTISENEWYDELHPTNRGFDKIAQAFTDTIMQTL